MRWLALLAMLPAVAFAEPLVVGSKIFAESYVLGEIAEGLLDRSGFEAEHQQGTGATAIAWEGLLQGSIDVYPEYTGTLKEVILQEPNLSDAEMVDRLAELGVGVTPPLGFQNTYAIAMQRERAEELGIATISDLQEHPSLSGGLSVEFLGRDDGWPSLRTRYELPQENVRGLEHTLGYQGLAAGTFDFKDVYSTDAEIAEFDLLVLQDDLEFFPRYDAVYVYREDMPKGAAWALSSLANRIDEPLMIEMNGIARSTDDPTAAAAVVLDELPVESVTREAVIVDEPGVGAYVAGLTGRHLTLVGVSMLIAIIFAIPLGIVASKPGTLSQLILGFVGVVQTVPSLALLALLVPLLGASVTSAIVALFLYSLLPIVRNTATGLQAIPGAVAESATAMGLSKGARLKLVYLPMASRTVLAGIKTSAVINVGTATLAALLGVGGYGEPILRGITLLSMPTILQGAIPAALLALAVQLAFDGLDRFAIPKGLRLEQAR